MTPEQIETLSAWGKFPDADLPLLDVLWDLAALEKSHDEIEAAKKVIAHMKSRLPNAADKLSLDAQRTVMADIIHDEFIFGSDSVSALPENINLASVINRKNGLPVALAALYKALADHQGWDMQGINFPGHFLLQLGKGQQRVLIDPLNGNDLQASDLRHLLKETLGVHAELQHNHYQNVSTRQWIMRFYNNQKTALINDNKVDIALKTVQALLLVAPHEPRLLYDAAVLATRLEHIKDAIGYWDKFIVLSDNKAEKEEAKFILSSLQATLH